MQYGALKQDKTYVFYICIVKIKFLLHLCGSKINRSLTENDRMKAFKILAIIFAVIFLIGLIRFVGNMSSVNAGVFIFPAIIAIIFAFFYIRESRKK